MYKLQIRRHGEWVTHDYYQDHAKAKYRADDFARGGVWAVVINPTGTTIYNTNDYTHSLT